MNVENKDKIPLEIERKFLPTNSSKDWNSDVVSSELLFQTYLSDEKGVPYRVRMHLDKIDHKTGVRDFNINAVSCYKELVDNINGVPIYTEKELSLDFDDALETLQNNKDKLIVKRRSCVPFHEFTFEIDEYLTHNVLLLGSEIWAFEGNLQTIEVEFKKIEDVKVFNSYTMPSWLGVEVTNDSRYKNSNLAKAKKHENASMLTDYLIDRILVSKSYSERTNFIKPRF